MSAVIKDAPSRTTSPGQPAQPEQALRRLRRRGQHLAGHQGRRVPDLPRLQRLGQKHHPVDARRLRTPSSGEILVNGQSLVNVPPHKRDIGMVFQRYSLFPHLSVRDNIAFPLAIRKLAAPNATSVSTPCSSWCSWNNSPIAALRNCPAASSNASPSPARWSTSHASC
jgi:hypothetical protein